VSLGHLALIVAAGLAGPLIQAAAAENDSGADLADHDRHERSSAGGK
jgi:hypothetical protein